ncbi:MAG: DUF2958 domain-containing protein [Alphaproteobacteria bacterium]
MSLITNEQREQLLKQGKFNTFRRDRGEFEIDFKPVVKLFCPWGGGTWLLSELDPDDPDIAFGLCDLGFGFPELGSVSIEELESVTGPFGLTIERDLHFIAVKSLGEYAEEARAFERIVS